MMLTPLAATQWNRVHAAHLLNRAGFGGPAAQIDEVAQRGFEGAVRAFVNGPATPVVALRPEWAVPRDRAAFREKIRAAVAKSGTPPADMFALRDPLQKGQGAGALAKANPQAREAIRELRKAQRMTEGSHLVELSDWWLRRMTTAQDPLQEKLTLFWHSHFATSAQKVQDTYAMWRQNQTFRENARGNFGALAKAISRDPAMIFWLDLQQSRVRQPNENFARELMELFTLGEGHYTEADVTEAARAFTGYRVDPRDDVFRFAMFEHDAGPKRVLGRSGNFNGDDVIDILLAQPACATFLARKLWTFFAYDNPSAPIVDSLAGTLRANRYELRPVLTEIFRSAEFYSERAVRTQIKSPVQWLVGTVRTLEIDLPARPGFTLNALRQLGQVPFVPPSVKGWDGGKAWVSTASLLARYNLAGALLHGAGNNAPPGGGFAPFAAISGNVGGGTSLGKFADRALMRADNLPPTPATSLAPHVRVDLGKLVPPGTRGDLDTLVSALTIRLFQDPLTPKQQTAFVNYLIAQPSVNDAALLGLLHLMMSTPQYQLC